MKFSQFWNEISDFLLLFILFTLYLVIDTCSFPWAFSMSFGRKSSIIWNFFSFFTQFVLFVPWLAGHSDNNRESSHQTVENALDRPLSTKFRFQRQVWIFSYNFSEFDQQFLAKIAYFSGAKTRIAATKLPADAPAIRSTFFRIIWQISLFLDFFSSLLLLPPSSIDSPHRNCKLQGIHIR